MLSLLLLHPNIHMDNRENIINANISMASDSSFFSKSVAIENNVLSDKIFTSNPVNSYKGRKSDYVIRAKKDSSPYSLRRMPDFRSHLSPEISQPLLELKNTPVKEHKKSPPSPVLKRYNEGQRSQAEKIRNLEDQNAKLKKELEQCKEENQQLKEEVFQLQTDGSPQTSSSSSTNSYMDIKSIFQSIRDLDKESLEKLIVEVYIEIEKKEALACFF